MNPFYEIVAAIALVFTIAFALIIDALPIIIAGAVLFLIFL